MNRRIDPEVKHVMSYDGLNLYYEISGKGDKTLILIHGLGGDVAAWDEIGIYLNRIGYRTIVLDLRSHGFSDHPRNEEGFSLDSFSRDIRAIVEQENLTSYILIGHCFGGIVAYNYEFLYPRNAESLILINSSYRAPYISQESFIKRSLHTLVPFLAKVSPSSYTPRHVDYTVKGYENDFEAFGFFQVLRHNSLKTFLSATNLIFSLNVLHALKQISIPTLIISGTKDSVYPQQMSQELHKRIPNSIFVSVQGANHPIVLNNPMETATAIHRFLKHG